MTEAILAVGTLCTLFFAMIGLLMFTQIFILPKRKPMDESNRIGHLRLVWFAIKSPHKFTGLYFKKFEADVQGQFQVAFPWLKKDEGDIVEGRI